MVNNVTMHVNSKYIIISQINHMPLRNQSKSKTAVLSNVDQDLQSKVRKEAILSAACQRKTKVEATSKLLTNYGTR